ncbi:tryptophan synthase subunit alpha [soil metagenome]|nr:tryptophan synthase subunit alpha [Gemmatimonadota bacterium]
MSATISSDRTGAIATAFAECAAERRAALVVFTVSGHPSPKQTSEALHALADSGADVIELGVPFSDPLADGPIIQSASYDAIGQGTDLSWTLDTLASFHASRSTPVVLFTYLNPILRYGVGRFLKDATDAGAAGVLVTDLPVGADAALESQFARSQLDLIRLLAPTTPASRVREVAAEARGFLYYISRTGVTGTRTTLAAGLAHEVAALREATSVPIAVGFGISTAEQAGTVAQIADGVVVGSALVKTLAEEGVAAGARFVEGLRAAMPKHG